MFPLPSGCCSMKENFAKDDFYNHADTGACKLTLPNTTGKPSPEECFKRWQKIQWGEGT